MMRSPGRPPAGRREHRVRFWAAIARGFECGRGGRGGGVGGRWRPMVPGGWGMPSVIGPAVGALSVVCGAGGDRAVARPGCGVREIARRLGRSPSTISRELRRNAATRSGRLEYRASTAQWHADRRARRPKPAKLAVNARAAAVCAGPPVRRGAAAGREACGWSGGAVDRPAAGPAPGSAVGEGVEPGADLAPAASGLPG